MFQMFLGVGGAVSSGLGIWEQPLVTVGFRAGVGVGNTLGVQAREEVGLL